MREKNWRGDHFQMRAAAAPNGEQAMQVIKLNFFFTGIRKLDVTGVSGADEKTPVTV